MPSVRHGVAWLLYPALALVLAGCFLPGMHAEDAPPVSLTAARAQASSAAPVLPILVLRVARDELDLGSDDRAAVDMILDEATAKSRSLVHARAAFLEILAQAVESGAFDEGQLALYAEQIAWAADDAAPPLRVAIVDPFLALTGAQRRLLVTKVEASIPSWAPTWGAELEHRWPRGIAAHRARLTPARERADCKAPPRILQAERAQPWLASCSPSRHDHLVCPAESIAPPRRAAPRGARPAPA